MSLISRTYSGPVARPDLSLLPSLDALLHERSVTKAAARLGLSQPSLSAALARLRRHYGDPLLVRVGNSYELTPLAVRLLPWTEEALAAVGRVYDSTALVDPATMTRSFTVLGSDYPMVVIGAHASRLFAERAPRATLRLEHHSTARVAEAKATLRQFDAMLLPPGILSGLPSVTVARDTWVMVADPDNAHIGSELTLDNLAELPWVLPYHAETALMPPVRQLQLLGIDPHVTLIVESFVALPHHIRGTERITIMHRSLVRAMELDAWMRILECPFDAVPAAEALWWHPVNDDDPEHAWLRALLVEAGGAAASS
jgi:DNA-binding transcriptional LysR family regulator